MSRVPLKPGVARHNLAARVLFEVWDGASVTMQPCYRQLVTTGTRLPSSTTDMSRRSLASCSIEPAIVKSPSTLQAKCSRQHSRQPIATGLKRTAPGHGCSTIARNVLLNSMRRDRVEARARRRIGIHNAIEYTTDDLERIEAEVSQTDWATQLLAELPDEQRDAVTARIIDERSYPEIARQMKTSELVVRQRVSRGLSAIRSRAKDTT